MLVVARLYTHRKERLSAAPESGDCDSASLQLDILNLTIPFRRQQPPKGETWENGTEISGL
jgi:hypothetical protein